MTHQDKITRTCPVKRIGIGEHHHFFGYYNKSPWDSTGQYFLAQQVPMMTGDLTGKELAEIGYYDLEDNTFTVIGETTTWNWQMGSQLQWLEGKSKKQIIYNVRRENSAKLTCANSDFQSVIYDLDSKQHTFLDWPIYIVAPNSEFAMCVNFSRLQYTHETIGYSATHKEPELPDAPADDGVWRVDLNSGEAEMVLSLEQLTQFQPEKSMDNATHWVTHMEVNPSSSRLLFIHRWSRRVTDETCFLHRLFTINPDGSDLRLLECTEHPLPQLEADFDPDSVNTYDYEKSEYQISHPIWRNDHQIIVWGPHDGSIHYQLYDERSGEVSIIGENILTENGHMSYSPDGKWLLSDTYPDDDTNERLLFLYDEDKNQQINIGSFYTSPDLGKHNRCDLHPRWKPDGKQVCIDSVHEDTRQMYVLDVSEIIES